jgi:hypothetical protein
MQFTMKTCFYYLFFNINNKYIINTVNTFYLIIFIFFIKIVVQLSYKIAVQTFQF